MKNKTKHNSIKYMILMALACVIPLAILFILSFFGVSGKWTIASALVLMATLHMLMMKDHFSSHKERNGGKK